MSTVSQNLLKLKDIKDDIRAAINDKGGSLTTDSPFSGYSTAIVDLPSGGSVKDEINFAETNADTLSGSVQDSVTSFTPVS